MSKEVLSDCPLIRPRYFYHTIYKPDVTKWHVGDVIAWLRTLPDQDFQDPYFLKMGRTKQKIDQKNFNEINIFVLCVLNFY